MPVFDFRCDSCGAERSVFVSSAAAEALALLCIRCGKTMHRAPVLKVAYMATKRGHDFAASSAKQALQGDGAKAKSCGHHHACRCSIKLKRPNPFRKEIKQAAGRGNSTEGRE